uniref:Serine/threonine-protein phosphatase 7 long form homolog n=1 Tax=Nicotiana tabacum TaxID=4097 RepID=A0A1S3ZFC9_TOBAC|nr:PREDICTED: uncharacterized protein LOC107786073 [Nicotiana tabacum]
MALSGHGDASVWFSPVLPRPIQWDHIHLQMDRRSPPNFDWQQFYSTEVLLWHNRRSYIETLEIRRGNEDDTSYTQWYNVITRHLVGHLDHQFIQGYQTFAGKSEVLARARHRVHRRTLSVQDKMFVSLNLSCLS